MYSTFTIANEFILKSSPEGIEHLKLQKLVFSCYGWWLSRKTDPVISERPVSGEYGPFFPSLFDDLSHHGRQPVTDLFTDADGDVLRCDEDDEEVRNLIDWVWGRYGDCSAQALATICHRAGTPWHRHITRDGKENAVGKGIPLEIMKEYYEDLAGIYFGYFNGVPLWKDGTGAASEQHKAERGSRAA